MFRPDLPGRGWVLDPASPRREASLFNSAGNHLVFRPFFYLPTSWLLIARKSGTGQTVSAYPIVQFTIADTGIILLPVNSGAADHGDQWHQQHWHLYSPGPTHAGGRARSPFRRPCTGPAAATASPGTAPARKKPVPCSACAAGTRAAGTISRLHHRHIGVKTGSRLTRSACACRDCGHPAPEVRTDHPHAVSHRRCCSRHPRETASTPYGAHAACQWRRRTHSGLHPTDA